MKHAVEVCSGAMIYIPNFSHSGADWLAGGIQTTYRQDGDNKPTLFFKIRKISYK
jgi:hypothetical protein